MKITVYYLVLLKLMETESTRHADWFQATVDTLCPQLSQATTVDVQELETRREIPYVLEGNHSELASPFGRDADSTEKCGDLVAKTFP